jgi:hypothetical protein
MPLLAHIGSSMSKHLAANSNTNIAPQTAPTVHNKNQSASANLATAQQNNGKKSGAEFATPAPADPNAANPNSPKPPKVPPQGVSGNFKHEEFLQLTQENKSLKAQLKSQEQAIQKLSEQINKLTKEFKQRASVQKQQQTMPQNISYYTQPAPMPYMPHASSMQQPYVEPIDLELFADYVKKSHGNIDAAERNFYSKLTHLYPANSNNAYRNSIAYAKQVRSKYCMQGYEHNMRQQTLAHHNYMTQVNYYNASQMQAMQQQCLMQMGVFGNNFGTYPYQMMPAPMMHNYMPPPQPTFYNSYPATPPEPVAAKPKVNVAAAASTPKQTTWDTQKQAILDMADAAKNAVDNMLQAHQKTLEELPIQNLNDSYLKNRQEINTLLEQRFFINKDTFDSYEKKQYFICKIAQHCFPDHMQTDETKAIHATKALLFNMSKEACIS